MVKTDVSSLLRDDVMDRWKCLMVTGLGYLIVSV